MAGRTCSRWRISPARWAGLQRRFPVRLAGGSGDGGSLIKAVKEELRAIPDRGLGYGVLRYLGSEGAAPGAVAAGEPQIVFNYLGRFDGSAGEGALVHFAPESSGPSRSATAPLRGWLSINGTGARGTSASVVRISGASAIGERRSNGWRRSTSGPAGTGGALPQRAWRMTPSDVALSGLGQADLDRLGLDWRRGRGHLSVFADAAGHAVPCAARWR